MSAPATPGDDLRPVVLRPSLGNYLRATWRRRDFATAIAFGELRGQHMDSVLGNLWHVINPLLLAGIYYLIFGVLLDVSRGVENFLAFIVVGVFVFHYSQKSIISGAGSVVSNEGLIRSIRFPRVILPLSTVLGHTLAFMPAIGVMLVITLISGQTQGTGESPGLQWLLLVPMLALQALFNAGVALILARLVDVFRDVQNVLPYLFRLLFYMSGVLYAVDRFTDNQLILTLFDANPFYVFITLARGPLLEEMSFQPHLAAIALGWTVGVLVVGVLFFRAGEEHYGRG